MNISQHVIIPLGYPVKAGYYQESGVETSSANYKHTSLSPTCGTNTFLNLLVNRNYGNIRFFEIVEGVKEDTVNISINTINKKFNFPSSMTEFSYMTNVNSSYINYINYPTFVFFNDNTPVVSSLSLGNSLSSDVINDEEEMI